MRGITDQAHLMMDKTQTKQMTETRVFNVATKEMMSALVEKIVSGHQLSSSTMDYNLAHRLLLIEAMELGVAINDIVKLNDAVKQIVCKANNVFEGSNLLNILELKKRIANLPDCMPVMIEKLDNNWHTTDVIFEHHKVSKKMATSLTEEDLERVVEINGELFIKLMSPAVQAFSAVETEDKDGKRLFVIFANY